MNKKQPVVNSRNQSVKSCEKSPGCVQACLNILGDKWSALLLKSLAETGPQRFSDLAKALPKLSERTLSARLNFLTNEKIIEKTPYTPQPLRHRYALTSKGSELITVLRAMATWGEKYRLL